MAVTYESLRQHVDAITLVDTHEHIEPEAAWLAADEGLVDFSRFFMHYASVDLVSAGMPATDLERVRSADTPLDDKWALFEPHWEKARNTAYCRAVDMAIRRLFDLPGLSRDTYRPFAERMRECRKPGYYRWVLKEKANIAVSVLDGGTLEVDRELFVPAIRFDDLVFVRSRADLKARESQCCVSIHSPYDLVNALEAEFQRNREGGMACVKSGLAYERTLAYANPSEAEACRAFEVAVHSEEPAAFDQVKPLQDYVFHRLVQLCVEHDVPMQIHTGLQEGNGNYLEWTNPLHLTELLMTYPGGRFDLFHAGYPYWRELAALAKMFPGVHADLCWTNIITAIGSRRALSEWLELIPASKIFAFGGDYLFVEGVVAHAEMARENVARVLAQKVEDNYLSHDDAARIATMVLRDNARSFFRLEC
ncbi:MAG: amidohydrolase family protein [Fimbriimonadia bacterium]|jgi:hypothetical protein